MSDPLPPSLRPSRRQLELEAHALLARHYAEKNLTEQQARARNLSLRDFMRAAWPVIETATPLVWGWHLDAVCEHVEALLTGKLGKRNLAVLVPPGFAKSTVVSVAAPLLSKDLGLDAAVMGLIFSAFSWTYAAAQIPGGVLLDRFGVRLNQLGAILSLVGPLAEIAGPAEQKK